MSRRHLRRTARSFAVCAALAALGGFAGCSGATDAEREAPVSTPPGVSERTQAARDALPRGKRRDFGKAPSHPSGPLAPELEQAIGVAFGDNLKQGTWAPEQVDALRAIALAKDVRAVWILSDLLRIIRDPGLSALLASAASELMHVSLDRQSPWDDMTDRLIAWDIPAPPGYLDVKRRIFTSMISAWEPLFAPGDIDWRHVSWGGVPIDDRPFGKTDERCNCIPAADDPAVADAAGATWPGEQDVVFGIEVGGHFRAYPRQIMEVREMVNDTLGGRDLGIPYCTLCGSAQAYFTDRLPRGVKRPVLRTSGLLIRSNKVMYDLVTFSIIDTFRGNAVTGPLHKRGIKLEQAGVVTTTWGQWKAAHPETTVLVEDLALGRNFDFRNNRDANGPIFPIGNVDPRLPVHEDVLGVITGAGPVAFHIGSALSALSRGESIAVDEVRLVLDGGGVRAVNRAGKDVGGHQAFWFAWSQFHPETRLWPF